MHKNVTCSSLLFFSIPLLRVWNEYVWIRAACYARAYTTFNDVTASTVRHWLKSYGLAVQARGCPPGSDVPRPTIDQSAHDFSLLSLSRVPCTVGCPIPVPRKRGVFCATASMFSTYTVFIFSPYQRVYGRFCVSVTFFRESFTT